MDEPPLLAPGDGVAPLPAGLEAASAGPPAPPLYGAKRALKIFAAFWATQLLVTVGVVVLLAVVGRARGASLDQIMARLLEPPILLGATIASTALATLVLFRMARRTFGGAMASAALTPAASVLAPLGWAPTTGRACARGAGQALGLLVAFILVDRFLPQPQRPLGPLARAAMAGGWSRVAWAAVAVLIAPPSEELLFRGVLYTGLARSWGPGVGAVVTTLMFAALHFSEIGGYWPAWIMIGGVGALALRARVVSGSLLPAIAVHATYNFGLVLVTFAAAPPR